MLKCECFVRNCMIVSVCKCTIYTLIYSFIHHFHHLYIHHHFNNQKIHHHLHKKLKLQLNSINQWKKIIKVKSNNQKLHLIHQLLQNQQKLILKLYQVKFLARTLITPLDEESLGQELEGSGATCHTQHDTPQDEQ